MRVDAKKVLHEAKIGNYAIPACNFIDSDSARAYCRVAEKEKKPLILSYAEKHQGIISLEEAAMIGNYFQEHSQAAIVLHLDHGEDKDFIKRAIELGFNSVMIDASSQSFEENVRLTKEIVDLAKDRGVQVEAELGHVGANELVDKTGSTGSIYTEAESVKRFVDLTQVDSLAVSIGTAHGLYKGTPKISFEALDKIRKVCSIPLVLHGGSSSGDENLSRCARAGISKINIYTDFITAAFTSVQKDAKVNNWIDLKRKGQLAMENTLRHYYEVFHTKNYKE